MTQTTFVNGITLTDAGWFNDVDALVYPPDLSGTAITYKDTSFTGTLTGCTTAPTYTFRYVKIGNLVTLTSRTQITATSNTTAKTITGVPALIRPMSGIYFSVPTSDAGAATLVTTATLDSAGTITFFATQGDGNWTASGTMFIRPFTISYLLT